MRFMPICHRRVTIENLAKPDRPGARHAEDQYEPRGDRDGFQYKARGERLCSWFIGGMVIR
jgi:hypothetical protein